MHKRLIYAFGVVLLSASLFSCSSPEEKADNYIESAVSLFEEGKLNKAEIEYKNALQINQNLPKAWYGLARIYERNQDWRKTYSVLKKVRELAPEHVDARIMLGQILLASGQIDQAMSDAKDILEMAPGDARSHSLMAAVQYRLENLKGAQQEIDKALAIDPENSEAILVRARVLIAEKKYNEALAILNKTIKKDPQNISMYLMKIQVHQETNNTNALEGVYQALVKRFPDNVSFKKALAKHYLNINDIDRAESLLELIVSADPSNVAEKLNFVEFKNRFRSADDAVALLRSYIRADQEEYRYRFLLGEFYERNGQADSAQKVYQEIVADDGLLANGLEARNKLALLALRAGNRDKAMELVNEVLGQDKANENALLLQAGFQVADQRFDDAVVTVRTILRDNPDSIKAMGLLGQAYDANGSSELAVKTYSRAFQLSPGTALIANRLAAILVRQRKYSQADEILVESISRGNRSVDSIKLLAQVKLALSEWDKAEQLARRLQNIEGQEAIGQQVLGVVFQGKQDQAASIEAFKRAHELAPSSAQPIVALVRTYIRGGKVDDARRFLNSVLALHNESITANLLLGQINLYEKNMPGAIKYFNRVIEINPEIEAGYRGLVAIYARTNNLEKAEVVAKQGLSVLPNHPALIMNLASIYEKQKKFDKAIDSYESLIAKNPQLLVARNNLASLLTDYRQDQASLKRARDMSADLKNSQIPQFRDTFAWASVKSGTNLEEAISILNGIIKENGHIDVFNFHLGEAYRKKGDIKLAAEYLGQAVKLAGPGTDIAKMAQESLQKLQ